MQRIFYVNLNELQRWGLKSRVVDIPKSYVCHVFLDKNEEDAWCYEDLELEPVWLKIKM